ncbi:MAG: hypothetical protein QNL05_13500 [Gammaproteobacteria bacterium]|nr:hypothetical protein [Gammaproteobacteria bacterium]
MSDDCMDAGRRAPKAGALGDAWSNCREQLANAGHRALWAEGIQQRIVSVGFGTQQFLL